MKVETSRGVGSSAGTRKASNAAPGFAPALDAPQRATATNAATAPHSLDAILALQAEGLETERRARQVRRGRAALDALETLERALAEGVAPGSLRNELESLRRASETTGEAGLDDVLTEIDIRVAVELAKLEKASPRA